MISKLTEKMNYTYLKLFAGMSFVLSLVLANSACFFWEYDGEEMPDDVRAMRR